MPKPSEYTPELAEEIAALSAEGKSLLRIVKRAGMPTMRTLQRWRRLHPDFDRLLNGSHLERAQLYVEESIEISDQPVANAAEAARQRNRIHARQWAAARLDPARYAERNVVSAHVETEPAPTLKSPREQRDAARDIAFALSLGLRAARAAKEEADGSQTKH